MGKDNSKLFILILLGMLTAFGPFVTDMVSAEPSVYGRIFQYKFFDGSVRTDYKYDRAGRRADILRSFE